MRIAILHSPDGDTEYFDIVAGVLQGDTLTSYLFIICRDYILRTSIDKIRENGFELTKKSGGMPLFPTKMADAQCSVSGNHWSGGPRDMLTTTSAHVNSSPAFLSHQQDGIFCKYVVFKHTLSL